MSNTKTDYLVTYKLSTKFTRAPQKEIWFHPNVELEDPRDTFTDFLEEKHKDKPLTIIAINKFVDTKEVPFAT